MSEIVKVDPIAAVTPIREHDWSVYPDIVRVPMKNGKVVNYYRQVDQPAPVFAEALDRYDRTCQVGGYKYKQKGRGKRLGRRKKEEEKNGGEGQEHV